MKYMQCSGGSKIMNISNRSSDRDEDKDNHKSSLEEDRSCTHETISYVLLVLGKSQPRKRRKKNKENVSDADED